MIEASLHPRQAKRGVDLGDGTNTRQTAAIVVSRARSRAAGVPVARGRAAVHDDVLVDTTVGIGAAGAAGAAWSIAAGTASFAG
ncbi:hypothetical protein, partial [Burkholderia multivorans]